MLNPEKNPFKEGRLIYANTTPPPGGTPITPPPTVDDSIDFPDDASLAREAQENYDSEFENLKRLRGELGAYVEKEDGRLLSDMDNDIKEMNAYSYHAKFLEWMLRMMITKEHAWFVPGTDPEALRKFEEFKQKLNSARKVLGLNDDMQRVTDEEAIKGDATQIVKAMLEETKKRKRKAEQEVFAKIDATIEAKLKKLEESPAKDTHKGEDLKKKIAGMRKTLEILERIASKSKPEKARILREHNPDNAEDYDRLYEPSEEIVELQRQCEGASDLETALSALKAYLLAHGIKSGDPEILKKIVAKILRKHIQAEKNGRKRGVLEKARNELESLDDSTSDVGLFIVGHWYLISPEKYGIPMSSAELDGIKVENDFTDELGMRSKLMSSIKALGGSAGEVADDDKKAETLDVSSLKEQLEKLRKDKKEKVDSIAEKLAAQANRLLGRITGEVRPAIEKSLGSSGRKDLKEAHFKQVEEAEKTLKDWTNISDIFEKSLSSGISDDDLDALLKDGNINFANLVDEEGNKREVKLGIADYIKIIEHPQANDISRKAAMLTAQDMIDEMTKNMEEPEKALTERLPEYDKMIDGYISNLNNKMRPTQKFQIYFLSFQDFKHMGEKLVEWAKRKYTRRTDENMGDFGAKLLKDLPGPLKTASNEFSRIKEHSEIEEVEQYENAYKNKDAWMIKEIMETTRNKDEFKACIKLLCHHGRMGWENTKFWQQLMYFTHGSVQFNIDNPEGETINKHMFEEKLSKAIGYLWDFDTYETWVQENGTNATSAREKYNSYCDQTAESAGGIDGAMKTMLKTYKEEKSHGHTPKIDPHKFEKLIHYGIDKGKGSPESKIYYLIQGVACGLLPWGTLSKFSSQHINEYPIIDLFGSDTKRGERPTKGDIKEWAKMDWDLNEPGAAFHKWWYTDILHIPKVYQRVGKALQQGVGQDHDDATGWFGAGDMNTMKSILQENAQGARMPPTGLQNGTVGFLQYLDNMIEFGDELGTEGEAGMYQQFARFVGAFMVFDGITNNRVYADDRRYFRWRGMEEREPRSTYIYGGSYGRGMDATNLAKDGGKTDAGFTSGKRTIDYVNTIKEYIGMFDEEFFDYVYKSDVEPKEKLPEMVAAMQKKYGDNVFGNKPPRTVDELHESTEIFIKNAMKTGIGRANFNHMRARIKEDHAALIKKAGIGGVRTRLERLRGEHGKKIEDEIAGKAHVAPAAPVAAAPKP
ncbi:MAG: hypothetical protein UW03_C0040G0002 [Candidatus Peregrinibacteria bacterium GW2011_GWA2_43_8]|nr:MAG: hypothetical protein UW03_C0040G0002 [Candidatus Peregrinibacteria bacterium GW2011_GWA2_43_8]